ncbi:MAG: flagellar export chaperone FliS [Longimicrobiales bacterium]
MSTQRSGRPVDAVAAAYRRSRVLTGSPAELVVLLYERLLADLEGSAIAIRAGDLEAKAVRLQRATDVIFELLGALDHEVGGEVSQRLAALYTYMITRLGEASRTLDVAILEELSGHVRSLLTAWRTVAEGSVVADAATGVSPR